jgi:transposase
LLEHDNARSHTSLKTLEGITKFGWAVLPHPPYSPDQAPSGFHLFGALKGATRSTKFENHDEVIRAVATWQREQDNAWYRQGTATIISRWCKAAEVDRDLAEK